VPLGATSLLRLGLPAPLATDLAVQLSVVDTAIATLPSGSVVLPAGQTEIAVPVTGVSTGATTIVATSARGTTWAIAAVSPDVSKPIRVDGASVGLAVVPARSLGQVFTAPNGQSTIVVPIFGAPAVVATPVDVTSSNGSIASVSGAVTVAQGSQTATITITTGSAGTVTLTLRAGNEIRQLTIVVGTPAPGTAPPTVARPVGVVAISTGSSSGRIFTAPGGQSMFRISLLSTPAGAATPVTVTSSNPSVADVAGPVTIPAGQQVAEITVTSGVAGTATLTFRAGTETRQVIVVVGTPPAGTAPPIVASPVGLVVLAAPSAGRLITNPATQGAFTLLLVSAPVVTATPVTVTSSNPNVATVTNPVVIAAGARVASVNVVTGVEGTATLTFRAGSETRQLTIVVGTPAPGTVPPVIASPVGVVVIAQRRLGSVFSAIGGQPNLNVTFLSTPAESPTTVTVSSSDPNVAVVNGPVVVGAGSRVAGLTILTGIEGVATLTLRAGSEVAQIVVVVGTPPASLRPLVTAPIVGVEIKK
jgi:hypothetical protein